LILVVIGFTVFPLLGVINFQTNGLIGGFGIGLVIALVVSMLKKEEK
jgi:high-affinity Fe2+/Pb2+ permease